jgi:hypothetical protein
MAKAKRKSRKASIENPEEFLKPIDITQFGTDDDPCFGKQYNLSEPECKRCGDSELCAIVFSQNLNLERKNIEGKNRFKDLELSKEETNPALEKWVGQKIKEGLKRSEIISAAKKSYGSTRDEIKTIYKKLTNGNSKR